MDGTLKDNPSKSGRKIQAPVSNVCGSSWNRWWSGKTNYLFRQADGLSIEAFHIRL